MLQLKTKMEGKTMYLRIMTLFQFIKNNISQKKTYFICDWRKTTLKKKDSNEI